MCVGGCLFILPANANSCNHREPQEQESPPTTHPRTPSFPVKTLPVPVFPLFFFFSGEIKNSLLGSCRLRRNSTNNIARQQQRRKQTQRLVVVRKDWSVVCFDHRLNRLWANDLKHEGSPVGKDASSFVIDQVCSIVAPSLRSFPLCATIEFIKSRPRRVFISTCRYAAGMYKYMYGEGEAHSVFAHWFFSTRKEWVAPP